MALLLLALLAFAALVKFISYASMHNSQLKGVAVISTETMTSVKD